MTTYHFDILAMDLSGETIGYRPWSYLNEDFPTEDAALDFARAYATAMYNACVETHLPTDGVAVRVSELNADEYLACYTQTARGADYFYGEDIIDV